MFSNLPVSRQMWNADTFPSNALWLTSFVRTFVSFLRTATTKLHNEILIKNLQQNKSAESACCGRAREVAPTKDPSGVKRFWTKKTRCGISEKLLVPMVPWIITRIDVTMSNRTQCVLRFSVLFRKESFRKIMNSEIMKRKTCALSEFDTSFKYFEKK